MFLARLIEHCGLITPFQAAQVDMLVGSVANGLCSSGGFCAGSSIVTEHQVGHMVDTL